jgi:tRNA(Ile)-lysidine synthase
MPCCVLKIMCMLEDFLNILTGPCMVKKQDSVLVCCSGGVDSMVLLHLMKRAALRMGLKIGAVHIDHGIRGQASHNDAVFVKRQCKNMGIECYVYELGMSADSPNLEEEARLRRYAAIMKCRKDHEFDYAATGHTMNDQAETLIHRFIRGSGIRGLAGMDYISDGILIRPLLGFGRSLIDDYAKSNGVCHVLDSSNEDIKHVRNLIRHELIPLMKKINPSVVTSISRLSDIAREEGKALDDMANFLEKNSLVFDWEIVRAYKTCDILEAPGAVAKRMIIRILSEMLFEPRGIDAVQIQGVMDVLHSEKRAHTVKRKVKVQADGQTLVFSAAKKGPFFDIYVQNPGIYQLEGINRPVKIEVSGKMVFPVRIRSFMSGDRICGKRVVRILSDHGIMKSLRDFWPVLLYDEEVVGIAGIYDGDPQLPIKTEFPYDG